MTNEELTEQLIEQSENATELFKILLSMIKENRKEIEAINKTMQSMIEAYQLY